MNNEGNIYKKGKNLKIFFWMIANLILVVIFNKPIYANDLWHDLSNAKIVIPDQITEIEQSGIRMFVDEVMKRTNIEYIVVNEISDKELPIIVIGSYETIIKDSTFNAFKIDSVFDSKDGFSIIDFSINRNAPTIFIIGNDSRGMLFGVGYFLRKIIMEPPQGVSTPERFPKDWQIQRTYSMFPGKVLIPNDIFVENSYPFYSLRGHQLGYRPKVNAYDGFDELMYEQYIRDLIVFGTNAIELIPPNTDDASYSPMFSKPQMEMNDQISRILAKYGLDVWLWYPLMYGDYSDPSNFQASLDEAENVFKNTHKINALFVPGGDPGHTPPKILFEYLKKEKEILNKYHPEAEIWVSPQGFSIEWFNEFIELVNEQPDWLTGIVHGPWVRMNVDSLRKIIPNIYPIRRYPDITHSIQCEYPVPKWDLSYSITQHREVINPRPIDQSIIFHSMNLNSSCGFISYSEGVNDDVNKIIWSGLGWNPNSDIFEILQDYSRYFIGANYTYEFADGILGLEKNWIGPLINNNSVDITLMKFQDLEKESSPRLKMNWRFQQALYRSYYDAYIRSRLIYEAHLEDAAMGILRRSSEIGSLKAIELASEILDKSKTERVSLDLRQRVFEMAEALFQSIHMQLSVDKYHAISIGRGANLDLIDEPLNNSVWLFDNFDRISRINFEEERLLEIAKIINWENPGPGGYYIDFGDLSDNTNLVSGANYKDDPGFWHSPLIGWRTGTPQTKSWRTSWKRYIHTLFNHPLELQFKNLDPQAYYELKVVYLRGPIKLVADGQYIIHDYFEMVPWNIEIRTYDIPYNATNDGTLTLKWDMEPARGSTGRGNKLGELWLVKKTN